MTRTGSGNDCAGVVEVRLVGSADDVRATLARMRAALRVLTVSGEYRARGGGVRVYVRIACRRGGSRGVAPLAHGFGPAKTTFALLLEKVAKPCYTICMR